MPVPGQDAVVAALSTARRRPRINDDVLFHGEIGRLAERIDQLEADLRRAESFAASSFVLAITLIREMLVVGQLPAERAAELVRAAIGYLRRMYQVGEVDPFEGDAIDFDRLTVALSRLRHEKGAEDLLKELLASLERDGAPPPG
jgi:hypothetical protein